VKYLKTAVIAVILLAGLSCNNPAGHTYYVSAAAGNDANDGLSPEKAWKSLDKVNVQHFAAGDRILFQSGSVWHGQLRPQGSGTEGAPVCIDRYGEGALPKIDQDSLPGAVLLLENQEYWEINHLELTASMSQPGERKVGGIHVIATTADHVLKHIVIRNCVLHHLTGIMKMYEHSAIWVGVPGYSSSSDEESVNVNEEGHRPHFATSFDEVLIENNRIYEADRCGILVWTSAGPGRASIFLPGLIPSRNVVIRGNLLEDIGGDGILVLGSDRPLVERNTVRRCCKKAGDPACFEEDFWAPCAAAVWFHHCLNGVIQYNAVYDCARLPYNLDGMAYDFDYNCDGCILQYNYSRNNAGGFLLLMNTAVDNIIRYNISENDRTHILFLIGAVEENNRIYNNTFYVDSDTTCIIPRAHIENNIFMATGTGKIEIRNWSHPKYTPWSPELGVMRNNCYAGNCSYPFDSLQIAADPLFANPGNGGGNVENLACYAISADSPCRKKGLVFPSNGAQDILGNPIPPDTPPDIGAIQSSIFKKE
jgi:hypothetical protein